MEEELIGKTIQQISQNQSDINTQEKQKINISNLQLKYELYDLQLPNFPTEGCHIMGQQTENTIVVYQAFKPSIAKYTVQNQKFGGTDYLFNRTSWVKTNFLWMMYRSGWATKKNQERILAIWIPKDVFIQNILEHSFTTQRQKREKLKDVPIRLQWDPDYDPYMEKRKCRAIQLGIKPCLLQKFSDEWIVKIEDITNFVYEQRKNLTDKGQEYVKIPIETELVVSQDLQKKLDMI